MKRIVDTVTGHLDVPGYSRNVPLEEIRANGYNLNIPRYVQNRETEHWDIRAIMEGGIPEKELDGLGRYWEVFGGVREALFEVAGNYARVKVGDVAAALADMPSVKEYAARTEKALDGFDAYLKHELLDSWETVEVNAEEGKNSDELFRRLEGLPLIDKYDAYQLLDDEWIQTELDLETMQAEGFEAVRKIDEETTIEGQDERKGRILPFELVQRELFADELAAIGERVRKAERLEAELSTLVGELPEEERDGVTGDEGEFDEQSVLAKAKEILADIETEETRALDEYLTLKGVERKRFPSLHLEVDWATMEATETGLYGTADVKARRQAIREAYRFPEGAFEELVVRASRTFQNIKLLRKEEKTLRNALEAKTREKIQSLTDTEAMQLLEAKWVRPLAEKLGAMPWNVVGELTRQVKALVSKYATTLSEVSAEIAGAEKELAGLLGELEGEADDLAGIAEWKKELGR